MPNGMDYSLVQRIIDGTGRILDTTMSNPNTGSYITEAQLRDWIKGQTVQEGYYYNGNFYSNSGHTSVMAKVNGSLYVDKGSNALYYCLSSAYVALTEEAAVQAIRTELLNGTLEPLVSTKARQDQNGNVIDTTYATKAELAAEESARESADSDLQSQIVNINSEVDNIEALIGDEAEVENVDDTPMVAQSRLIHHANLLPYGSFGRVGARSVAWNQLIPIFSVESQTVNGVTWTNNGDGSYTANGTATANSTIILQTLSVPSDAIKKNHVYLLNTGYTDSTGNSFRTELVSRTSGNQNVLYVDCFAPSIVTPTDSGLNLYVELRVVNGKTANNLVFRPQLFDLTIMNEYDSTITDAQNIARFFSKFPASYYPYDTGHIYDLNPTSFRIRGINLWDEKWELGGYNTNTGEKVEISTRIRSKTGFGVLPNTEYFFMFGTGSGNVFFYDWNGNYISRIYFSASNSFTTPSNCFIVKIAMGEDYGATYKSDIQICLDSLPSSIKTTYHPYDGHTVDTPQIADGHYVNESVYDYVENVVEDGIVKGKKHKRVGQHTFDGTESWILENDYFKWNGLNDVIKRHSSTTEVPNLLIIGFLPCPWNKTEEGAIYVVPSSFSLGPYIWIKNSSFANVASLKAYLNGKTLYYELAKEEITDCEPLRSFPISDYSTVEPITPQNELVNRIDVPFSVKSVSANTLIEQIQQNTADIAEEKATRTAQVSALDKRVTNLELKTGDQFTVDYPSDTYGMNGVPSNVEPYAKVTKLRGVGRVANNLANLEPRTFTMTNRATGVSFGGKNIPSGHMVLISFKLTNCVSDATTNRFIITLVSSPEQIAASVPVANGTYSFVVTANNNVASLWIFLSSSNTSTTQCDLSDLICTDLTVYFNGNIPDGLDIATIQQNYPELLIPSDYNAGSIVDTTYSAVKSVGRNLFNPADFEIGDIASDTGVNIESSIAGRSKDYIPVKPNTLFYFYDQTINPLKMRYYDINKNYIGFSDKTGGTNAQNQTRLMPDNCFYIRFAINGVTSIADNAICVNLSDSNDGTFTPYKTDTLSLPSPVTLKGAGAVAEEYYPESGRITHPLYRVNLGNLTYEPQNFGNGEHLFRASLPNGRYYKFINNDQIANMICSRYVPNTYYNLYNTAVKGISYGYNAGRVIIIADSNYTLDSTGASQLKADLANYYLDYEQETPDPDTYVDPIPDPFIQVEGGGTIETIQTQTPEIDSAMTVRYMAS